MKQKLRGDEMDKMQIKKDSKVLFIGDSITDVKFNFRMMRKIKGRKISLVNLLRQVFHISTE